MTKQFACLLLMFISYTSIAQSYLNIVPVPAEIKPGKGNFIINRNTQILLEGSGLEKIATMLNDHLKRTAGFSLPVTKTGNSSNKIVLNFERMDYKFPGAYSMNINDKEIYIAGDNEAGVFYGIQTLIQLLPVADNGKLTVPQLSIDDHPRFAYRGMHLDVSRHFFTVDQVKKYIDHLAAYKFNTFHWHLTDDQGWRIEIKRYPKLTAVGGYRNGTTVGAYPGTGNDSLRYGGFYTQQEIKEVVKYAAEKYITIIPEIEMPGHASAAIAAYPQLSCFPNESTKPDANTVWAGSRQGKQVQQTWGVFEDVFAPTEYTFQFLENVLEEVIQLFPSKYIHIGGDECPKESWKRSPFCQQLIKEKKLKDEHELQSYFIQRIEKYINSKGRKIIGWDEILEGGLAPNAAVMSWRGEQGGIAAAKEGHEVVMTPENPLYLNHAQSNPEDSVTQGGYNPIEHVYNYEPLPSSLNEKDTKYVLGAQGNMWSEHLLNERKLEYMLFPRIAALSEALWSPKEKRNWKDFERRIPSILEKLDAQQINYSKAYYAPTISILPTLDANGIAIKVSSKKEKNVFYFGDKLKSQFKLYNDSIVSVIYNTGNYGIRMIGKMIPEQIGEKWGQAYISGATYLFSTDINISFNKATGKHIQLRNEPSKNYPGDGAFTLVNGIQNKKGMASSSDFLGFSGQDLDATIDLGKTEMLSSVRLHCFQQPASWIYLPEKVTASFSNDGTLFTDAVELMISDDDIFNVLLPKETTARYIRLIAKNAGMIKNGNPGSGNPAWLFADEIEVE